ncbi:MAG: S9 family peptidase [Candidatus Carbobacillus altaicus]|nr:S9 family peptidase [Candidatus Carbobacillus altaicus]
MDELKPYQIEDLYHMKWADEVVCDPRGEKAVYTVRWIDKEEDTYRSYLALVDLNEKTEAVRLTYGKGQDRYPRFLPDGRTLAFLSNREGQQSIYELPLSGGEARPVATIEGDVQRFFVTAAGEAYVALVRIQPKETQSTEGAHTSHDRASQTLSQSNASQFQTSLPQSKTSSSKKGKQPLVIERLRYKSDGRGLHDDSYSRLIWIERKGGKVTTLFDHLEEIGDVAVSTDGRFLAYTINRSDDTDQKFRHDIVIAKLLRTDRGAKVGATSVPTVDWKEQYMFYALIFHPTRPLLLALGHDYTYAGATMPDLFAVPFQGPPKPFTRDVPFYFGDALIGDMVSGSAGPILRFSADGKKLFAQTSEHGQVSLRFAEFLLPDALKDVISEFDSEVSGDSTAHDKGVERDHVIGEDQHHTLEFETIPFTPGHIYAWDLMPDGKTLLALYASPTEMGKLVSFNLETKELQKITVSNHDLERMRLVSEPEMFWLHSFDETPYQAWLMRPLGFRAGERYPLILTIHGGPHAMYGETFFHEFQVLAGKGFGILYLNPRGSHGYGQAFVDAVRGDYGGDDMRDLMHALDVVLERETWIDPSRLAVMGGSYGGFMTNWIISHTDRFRVAITDRSISNWLSFYGTSDIGTFFTEWEIGAHLYHDPERLWHHSPLKYAAQVKTPVLIIHSEQDLRCPIEQAEQWFSVLKKLGKEVRFLRFPDSNHDLSRNGLPSLRTSRLAAMVDWLKAHT